MSTASLATILERSYEGRRILVTGHNGFVGSWLSLLLTQAGAEVTGLSLPAASGGLARALRIDELVQSVEGDITRAATVEEVVAGSAPEIVFHLAAQALVIASYRDPLDTFATNVMGTAHVLDSLRRQPSVKACVAVTSDKCYATAEQAHVESDPLGGDDPYSASKAAAEIVAHAYASSYFSDGSVALATSRAGNIVGGGDWSDDRIVPDCARSVRANEPVVLRRPDAVRPWQHVLDATSGYLRLGDALLTAPATAGGAWNFGPPAEAAATVGELVSSLFAKWRSRGGTVPEPVLGQSSTGTERTHLTLDSSKARRFLGWRQLLDLEATIDWTVEWYAAAIGSPSFDARATTGSQIRRYVELDVTTGTVAGTDGLVVTGPGSP